MNPGPELDRAIAEQVMGWTLTAKGFPEIDQGNWINDKGHFMRCGPGSFIGLTPFAPSNNIAHAWEVVEHMRKSDARWDFRLSNSIFDDGWVAVFRYGDYTGRALTAPHAICLAALAAVNAKP